MILHPFTQTISSRLRLVAGLLSGILLFRLLLLQTDSPERFQWTLSAVYSLMLLGMSFLLWYFIRYTNFGNLNEKQRYWVHSAVMLLYLTLIEIGSYLFTSILLGFDPLPFFRPLIGISLLLSLLFYLIFAQYYSRVRSEMENEKQVSAIETELIGEIEKEKEAVRSDQILDRISIRSGNKIHLIEVDEIEYLEANGDYVMIHTAQRSYLEEETLKYFELYLPHDRFIRVHRSYVVNLNHAVSLQLYKKQQYLLTTRSNKTVKVSTNGYKLLREKI